MEFYHNLFDSLVSTFAPTLPSIPCGTTKYIHIGGKCHHVDINSLVRNRWCHILTALKINPRQMTLLELRDLMYEMAMYSSDDDFMKIKLLIERFEKGLSTSETDPNYMTKYSNLLKEYNDLEIKYNKLCEIFNNAKSLF